MITQTDDEARARDRAAARARETDGARQCPGWPLDHYCPTMIPWTRSLCTFCAGTRARDQAAIALGSTRIPRVSEVLDDLEPLVELCPCGGTVDGLDHEASLLHLTWVLGRPPSNVRHLHDTDSSETGFCTGCGSTVPRVTPE